MSSRRQRANALRFLAIDAVQKANSGHPGMPMGMADIAEVLWHDFFQHNPLNPQWINRDRFILSNGHGSMLLYALLHLSGYALSIEDLKAFRQWHSLTPGHPEHGLTPGVETTTGPLGQGLANAVGMALAEKMLGAEFNRPDFSIIDHFTYVFLGDGCLMEGISHEVCSLAGVWKLNKLICFWDDNGISIDGEVKNWFRDDTASRFRAYGWHVIHINGHEPSEVTQAIQEAQQQTDRPTLICCKTIIGYGSPHLSGTADTHGSPLGEKEIAHTRETLQWPHAPFEIPEEIYASWNAQTKGTVAEHHWQLLFKRYKEHYPDLSAELERRLQKQLPTGWKEASMSLIKQTSQATGAVATRRASLNCLNALAPALPELLGGSADLSGSNCTDWKDCKPLLNHHFNANYIHYGVREFGMCAILNGLALYGGFIPFGGTFLVFSDYARNAIRLSALMKQRVIYVLTHDSIGLGEDGPTHQPIEQAASLRLIPNLYVWRPCDEVETAVAWTLAIEATDHPTALLLSRQNLPAQPRDASIVSNIQRGGYILKDCQGFPDCILIATGSEIHLAMQVAEKTNKRVRVVSMPCPELFLQQSNDYQEQVLPAAVTHRLAIEAGVTHYWYRFVGLQGQVIGLDRFGESAPAPILFKEFSFTIENILEKIEQPHRGEIQ